MDILLIVLVLILVMRIWGKDIREKLKDIDDFLLADYREKHPEKERDWRTYEEQYALRIKEAMRQLKPLIEEAVNSITFHKSKGAPHALSLKQRVLLLLLQRLFQQSNRMMASMLAIFSALSDVDISYKTVERLYSDEEVLMVLHNLHIIILKKKGITNPDVSGDGTGYSLTIKKHYASVAAKEKDEAKEAKPEQGTDIKNTKKAFVYSFKWIDNKTKMYVAYGTSLKSEREAYDLANKMLENIEIKLNSVRLDRYYSCAIYVDAFDKTTRVYVIPKKNATLNGGWHWKETMIDFVKNTPEYLEQYFQRENSEAGWSADKKHFGWGIAQRRPDRIDTADFCTELWHNLFQLGATQ
jgi:transposase